MLWKNIWELVVTFNERHRIIHLFNNVKIFHIFKKFKYHQIQKFTHNINLRKQDILSKEIKIKITFWWYLNRYYSMILIWWNYLSSNILPLYFATYVTTQFWIHHFFTNSELEGRPNFFFWTCKIWISLKSSDYKVAWAREP